jgi:hypothetical protein
MPQCKKAWMDIFGQRTFIWKTALEGQGGDVGEEEGRVREAGGCYKNMFSMPPLVAYAAATKPHFGQPVFNVCHDVAFTSTGSPAKNVVRRKALENIVHHAVRKCDLLVI